MMKDNVWLQIGFALMLVQLTNCRTIPHDSYGNLALPRGWDYHLTTSFVGQPDSPDRHYTDPQTGAMLNLVPFYSSAILRIANPGTSSLEIVASRSGIQTGGRVDSVYIRPLSDRRKCFAPDDLPPRFAIPPGGMIDLELIPRADYRYYSETRWKKVPGTGILTKDKEDGDDKDKYEVPPQYYEDVTWKCEWNAGVLPLTWNRECEQGCLLTQAKNWAGREIGVSLGVFHRQRASDISFRLRIDEVHLSSDPDVLKQIERERKDYSF